MDEALKAIAAIAWLIGFLLLVHHVERRLDEGRERRGVRQRANEMTDEELLRECPPGVPPEEWLRATREEGRLPP